MKSLKTLQPDSANVLVGNFLLLFSSGQGPSSMAICPCPSSLTVQKTKEHKREVSIGLGSPGMSALGIHDKVLWSGNMPKQKGSERFRQLSQLFDRILGFKSLSRLDTPNICPLTSPRGALKVTKGRSRHPYLSRHRGQSVSPQPQLLSITYKTKRRSKFFITIHLCYEESISFTTLHSSNPLDSKEELRQSHWFSVLYLAFKTTVTIKFFLSSN